MSYEPRRVLASKVRRGLHSRSKATHKKNVTCDMILFRRFDPSDSPSDVILSDIVHAAHAMREISMSTLPQWQQRDHNEETTVVARLGPGSNNTTRKCR